MSFTPAIFYQDPLEALKWLERAFGFETTMLIQSADGDVRMMHSEMALNGKGLIMVGGEWADWAQSPKSVGGANTQTIHVHLEEDVDAHCARARAAGAIVESDPEDQFYGDRTYSALDLEGHRWTFGQHVRDVSQDEAEKTSGLKIEGWR